jgi:transcription initiation factor IIF auxiliary subunit
MRKHFDIQVRDSLLDPAQSASKEAHYRDRAERPLYQVWLFLDGPDLPYVDRVTYKLHPTFPNPLLTVERTPSNPNCKVAIWTWGIFTIETTIQTKTGPSITFSHKMTYGLEIEQAEINLMQVA